MMALTETEVETYQRCKTVQLEGSPLEISDRTYELCQNGWKIVPESTSSHGAWRHVVQLWNPASQKGAMEDGA